MVAIGINLSIIDTWNKIVYSIYKLGLVAVFGFDVKIGCTKISDIIHCIARTPHTRQQSCVLTISTDACIFPCIHDHITPLFKVFFVFRFVVLVGVVFVLTCIHIGVHGSVEQMGFGILLKIIIRQKRSCVCGCIFVDYRIGIGANGQHYPRRKSNQNKNDTPQTRIDLHPFFLLGKS